MRRLAAALVLASLAASASAGDVIVLADGRGVGLGTPPANPPGVADFASSTVTVLEENLDGVVYRLAGVPTRQTLTRDKVRGVVHDPALVPAELAAGIALLAAGKVDDGRAKLVAAARDAGSPAWAQAEAAFRRAESYATEGNASAAERALASFAQDRSRSRFVPDARRLRARLLVDMGRDDDAKAEYGAAAAAAGVTDDESLSFRFLAAWTAARAALRSGDAARLSAAAAPFAELRAKAAGHPVVIGRCDVAKAACGGAAEPLLALVAASEDPFTLAVGHTLLADGARRRGAEKKDRAALEEAQERYLRVTLLYRDAEGARDFAAAAQLHAGELFLELAPEDPAALAEARSRARREWEDLVRRAPRTDGAAKAKTLLAQLP